VSEEFIDICFDKVYKGFVEHIDAIDNGISIADGPLRYVVSTSLSARISHLNPSWNEPQSADLSNEQFRSAMVLACTEFSGQVLGLARAWWPAREVVARALGERLAVHPSGQIAVLTQACPWKDHLFDLEALQVSRRL